MRYFGAINSKQGDYIHIALQRPGQGEVEIGVGPIAFAADEAVTTECESSDNFDVLHKQHATIRLITQSFLPDLFTANYQEITATIKVNDKVVFYGYVTPKSYTQSFVEVWEELEINCVDALSVLEFIPYTDRYEQAKENATQLSLQDIIVTILGKVSDGAVYYDGSIRTVKDEAYTGLADLTLSDLLFLGDNQDDVWTCEQVLEEVCRYLNLHCVQLGPDFYLYNNRHWRSSSEVVFKDLKSDKQITINRPIIDLTTDVVSSTSADISMSEVYGQLTAKYDAKKLENIVESPLSDDDLTSPFSNRQPYMVEYIAEGEGIRAFRSFFNMLTDNQVQWKDAKMVQWFMQSKENKRWVFPRHPNITDNRNQQEVANGVANNSPLTAGIFSFGKIEHKMDHSDNSPTNKIDMTDYLVLTVNGSDGYPTDADLLAASPMAVYKGVTSGGVFSPADDDTTNYIVFSGAVILNPNVAEVDLSGGDLSIYNVKTVYSRNNSDGRYYLCNFQRCETPTSKPQKDKPYPHRLYPFTDNGEQKFEFKYSAIGESADHISKVAAVACMLIVGDKCVVEVGNSGTPNDFVWRKYKPKSACKDDDEYFAQSFTLGFNPKIGDKLVGAEFPLQNNIDYTLGVDATGTAIPIRKSDSVHGKVQLMILGPVNTTWDEVTRRHPTFFRHTKWKSTSHPLLQSLRNIMIKELEVKVYSDNGLINNNEDHDIIYSTAESGQGTEVKDLSVKIGSALTKEECRQLHVTNAVYLSTPFNTKTASAVTKLVDWEGHEGKPEHMLLSDYYEEYSKPRVELTISVFNEFAKWGGWYKHPALQGQLYTTSISYNYDNGEATITAKQW